MAYEKRPLGARGFTVLEVTMAMFVLVFGLLGILALFPVGMNSSKISIESTNCAILAQSALEYLKVDPMYGTTWPAFDQPRFGAGSVTVVPAPPPTSTLTCVCPTRGTVFTAAANLWRGHILMFTSGALAGKTYEIATSSAASASAPSYQLTFTFTFTRGQFDGTDSGRGDYVYPGMTFEMLGQVPSAGPPARFETIPPDFFNLAGAPPYNTRRLVRTEALSAPDFAVPTDANSECEYSTVCILSGRMPGTNMVRADILIYRNFNRLFAPEANQPPVRRFVTYLIR